MATAARARCSGSSRALSGCSRQTGVTSARTRRGADGLLYSRVEHLRARSCSRRWGCPPRRSRGFLRAHLDLAPPPPRRG
jgi:hypothetical protein